MFYNFDNSYKKNSKTLAEKKGHRQFIKEEL